MYTLEMEGRLAASFPEAKKTAILGAAALNAVLFSLVVCCLPFSTTSLEMSDMLEVMLWLESIQRRVPSLDRGRDMIGCHRVPSTGQSIRTPKRFTSREKIQSALLRSRRSVQVENQTTILAMHNSVALEGQSSLLTGQIIARNSPQSFADNIRSKLAHSKEWTTVQIHDSKVIREHSMFGCKIFQMSLIIQHILLQKSEMGGHPTVGEFIQFVSLQHISCDIMFESTGVHSRDSGHSHTN